MDLRKTRRLLACSEWRLTLTSLTLGAPTKKCMKNSSPAQFLSIAISLSIERSATQFHLIGSSIDFSNSIRRHPWTCSIMAIIEQRLDMLFYQRAIAIASATPHVSIFQVTPREEKGRGGLWAPVITGV